MILDKKIMQVKAKDCQLYLICFKGPLTEEDKFLEKKHIKDANVLLRRCRASKKKIKEQG